MARLNEPPVAPAASSSIVPGAAGTITEESLEAQARAKRRIIRETMRTKSRFTSERPPADFDEVKRRFIRQNRELAKNNSSQSLRIRSLELEVSKLLAENLDQRNQILGLQNQVQHVRGHVTSDGIRRIKDDFRTKIAELSGLIDGLQELEEVEEEWLDLDKGRLLSPGQRQYRQRQPLAELMQDAVMPTIAEGKSYPRQTLGAEEIGAYRLSGQSGDSGSPDLGPAPVAHFELSGSQESQPRSPAIIPPAVVEEDLLPSVNLETRRKRKDGGSKIEIRRHSILAQSPVKDDEAKTTMLRIGAKRKLADREIERPIKPPAQDDFTFSRKATAEHSSSEDDKATDVKPTPNSTLENETPTSPLTRQARKVLGEKSVNLSPKKTDIKADKSLKNGFEKPNPSKPVPPSGRPPSRGRRVPSIPMLTPQEEPMKVADMEVPPELLSVPIEEPQLGLVDTESVPQAHELASRHVEDELNPKTPAPEDIFSPTTGPSAKAEGRDTPPPANLSSSSNTTEGGQRPSRRARSAVNYAEPSLVVKMRRPGKQMVDAISGLQDSRRTINSSAEKSASSSMESTNGPRTIIIKREPVNGDSVWPQGARAANRRETTSPLREKTTDEYPPAPSATTDTSTDIEFSRLPTSAGNLSSVIATSRKRREQLDRRNSSQPLSSASIESAAAKKIEELDLYEFKDSPSPESEMSRKAAPTRGSMSSNRRHLSVPKDADTGIVVRALPAGRMDRAAPRRRSMML